MVMKVHYLACTQQDFSCQNGHISFALLLIVLGIVIFVGLIGAAVKSGSKSAGVRSRATSKPFTASVTSNGRYKPRSVTATTPSGVKVTVRCPHRNGHPSPDLAVKCGQAQKARIERTGR
jgi:hypothetical protein